MKTVAELLTEHSLTLLQFHNSPRVLDELTGVLDQLIQRLPDAHQELHTVLEGISQSGYAERIASYLLSTYVPRFDLQYKLLLLSMYKMESADFAMQLEHQVQIDGVCCATKILRFFATMHFSSDLYLRTPIGGYDILA